jgi:hypothetical protein
VDLTMIVFEPPAGIVKIPLEFTKVTYPEETEALSVKRVAPSNK